MRKFRLFAAAAAALSILASTPSFAAGRTDFKVCWTIYAGWMPWGEAKTQGIVSKWAKKYGINVDVVQLNDYVESINQYTAGKFDGCAMTNMDALTIPATGGVDSTALIVSDYSNGNDGVLIKGAGKKVADLKGQSVNLVQFSVSHYLLARALESAGLSERDLKVVNTSDADISAAFETPSVRDAVTWNPMLADLKAKPNVTEVFDSSKIPGEIMDMMVVNTKTLEREPRARQGTDRRMVRNGRTDAREQCRQHERLDVDGEGFGHRPRWLQGPTLDHRTLLYPESRARFRHQPDAAANHDTRGEVFVRSRSARTRRA